MDQVKLVIQFHQRLRGSEKEIAAKIKVAEKMVDHLRLRGTVKIDQNVAAENQIHALHEKHPGVVLQVQPAERDQLFHLGAHLQSLLIEHGEIFPLVIVGGVAQRVVAINTGLGGFDGTVVEVGGENFYRPAFQQTLTLLEHVHGQRICLFTCLPSRAPLAYPLSDLLLLFHHYLREDYLPQLREL